MNKSELSRRAFLAATTTTAFAATASAKPNTAKVVPGKISPNERLNVAAIGAGGKGGGDIRACGEEHNVVALCDVDWDRAAKAFDFFPNAKKYKDYRNMLEDITRHCAELVMQHSSPVTQLFDVDHTRDSKTLYQRFSFVKSIILSPEFLTSVHKVLSSPTVMWLEEEDACDIRRAGRFTANRCGSGR